MKRLQTTPRADWKRIVESQGLHYHTFDGQLYWDESVCYQFESEEIDLFEKATLKLNQMCLDAVNEVVLRERWQEFNIAPPFRDWIRESWSRDELTVVGRFDLAYDGLQPPKMLEYNADTPTGLLEAAVIQWYWMQDQCPEMDQFNSLHERLIEAWGRVRRDMGDFLYHFISTEGHVEDYMNVNYLRDTAMQAGLQTEYLPIQHVGYDHAKSQFLDVSNRPITRAFKLYPWEWLMDEEYGRFLPTTPVRWLEAPWKVLLSNKAIMVVLWELFPDSPYLLETSFAPLDGDYVEKPCQSREGQGVAIHVNGSNIAGETEWGTTSIYQRYFLIPPKAGKTPVIGSWMINGYAAGIGIREDDGLITGNDSRFVPHFFGS